MARSQSGHIPFDQRLPHPRGGRAHFLRSEDEIPPRQEPSCNLRNEDSVQIRCSRPGTSDVADVFPTNQLAPSGEHVDAVKPWAELHARGMLKAMDHGRKRALRSERDALGKAEAEAGSMSTTNWSHIVVTDGGAVSVIPINGNAAPGRLLDSASVLHVAQPEDAVSCLKLSRFFARQFCVPASSNGSVA
jgi:hypothetical protein